MRINNFISSEKAKETNPRKAIPKDINNHTILLKENIKNIIADAIVIHPTQKKRLEIIFNAL